MRRVIIVGATDVDYIAYAFDDARRTEGAKLVDLSEFRMAQKLFSVSLTKRFDCPGKTAIFSRMLERELSDAGDAPIVVFIESKWAWNSSCLAGVRRKYPSAICVLYFVNPLVEWRLNLWRSAIARYDYVMTCVCDDAKRLPFGYCPTPYPMACDGNLPAPKVDVSYLAYTGSWRDAHASELYKRFTAAGLSCDFCIVGKPDRRYEGIEYLDEYLPYRESMARELRGRAILELTQNDAKYETLRVKEAYAHGRKLITNNEAIRRSASYSFWAEDVLTLSELECTDVRAFIGRDSRPRFENPFDICRFLACVRSYCSQADGGFYES